MESPAHSAPRTGFPTDRSVLRAKTMFLSGPFGAGKTTAAIERISWLLRQERVRGDQILVLVPQPSLGQPYQEALHRPDMPAGALVQVATVASLARSSVALYWPLAARRAAAGGGPAGGGGGGFSRAAQGANFSQSGNNAVPHG